MIGHSGKAAEQHQHGTINIYELIIYLHPASVLLLPLSQSDWAEMLLSDWLFQPFLIVTIIQKVLAKLYPLELLRWSCKCDDKVICHIYGELKIQKNAAFLEMTFIEE